MIKCLFSTKHILLYTCRSVLRTMFKIQSLVNSTLPMIDVKSSGAELPAAMKVAPATSGCRPRAVIHIVNYKYQNIKLKISKWHHHCSIYVAILPTFTDVL